MKDKNTVLLVDDNNINRRVMASLLKGMNLEVMEAVDGRDALEKIENNSFKMVFLDVFMPILNGYETAKKIRLLDGCKSAVPIIAVTAGDDI